MNLTVRIFDVGEEHVPRHLAVYAQRLYPFENPFACSFEHVSRVHSCHGPAKAGHYARHADAFVTRHVRSVRLLADHRSIRGVPLQTAPGPANGNQPGSGLPSASPQKLWTLTPSSRTGRRPASVRSSNCTALGTRSASSRVGAAVWLRVIVVKSE